MSSPPLIVLFRRDLRLDDNPALVAAAATGRPIIPLFVLDPRDMPGAAAKWWLQHSIEAFDRSVDHRLVLRRGDTLEVMRRILAETGATAVHWNRRYEPDAIKRDTDLKAVLTSSGVNCVSHPGGLLVEPLALHTQAGTPFKVFTPFHAALLAQAPFTTPSARPRSPRWHDAGIVKDRIEDWSLIPRAPNWASGFEPVWTPGEAGARRRLLAAIDDVMESYADLRDRPDRGGTSRLSPHLAFGEISPRRVWQTISAHRPGRGRDALLRQIVWREFSAHLLFHFPHLQTRPLRPAFERFPWIKRSDHLVAWQRGRTGYPIVDAGMRELWRTGWMHNRARMVVASFLTKHLRIDWRDGAAWFLDTLVDADLANNAAGWQWVAGCGTDAAPYFRIFNPVLQGEKFDPAGTYVRHWVPELAHLPAKTIHAPWTASSPPSGYPPPIVDHGAARAAALASFKMIG